MTLDFVEGASRFIGNLFRCNVFIFEFYYYFILIYRSLVISSRIFTVQDREAKSQK
jgi:hypothetical protein